MSTMDGPQNEQGDPDRSDASMARPRRSVRSRLGVALALLLAPSLVVAGAWLLSGSHQVVPGLEGCQFIRARQAQIDCYTGQIRKLVRNEGTPRALAHVDRSAAKVITLGADCHLAWHPIGEQVGRSDARAQRNFHNIAADTTCQQGFAHGYTIGFLGSSKPSVGELSKIVGSDCARDPKIIQILNCAHAYGHTIARRTPRDADAAVHTCEQIDYTVLPGALKPSSLPGNPPPVVAGSLHQCLYKAYMEIGMLDLARGSKVANNCRSARGFQARKACYAYLPARVGALNGDVASAARACHTMAPKGEMRDACVKTFSLGLLHDDRCTLFSARVEQLECREIIAMREAGVRDAKQGAIEGNDPGAPEDATPPQSRPPATDIPTPS